jgi:hypothetical protein
VASLGSTTTTAVASTPNTASPIDFAKDVAYAGCMRTHGIPNWPDPQSSGDFLITPNEHLPGQGSPIYTSANKACEHFEPNNGQITPAEQQQALARLLKFSACMRANGLPNFPDPVLSPNGNLSIKFGADRNSPQFQGAEKHCRSLSPFP